RASGLIGPRESDVVSRVESGATKTAVLSDSVGRRVIVLFVHGDYLRPQPEARLETTDSGPLPSPDPSRGAIPPELASGLQFADGRLVSLVCSIRFGQTVVNCF